jgi:hypothetical protein
MKTKSKSTKSVLLLESPYLNKYPPMGLMKLSTYFREHRGYSVRFFKGKLTDLVLDIFWQELLQEPDIVQYCNKRDWILLRNNYPQQIRNYISKGDRSILDNIDGELLNDNIDIKQLVVDVLQKYRIGMYAKTIQSLT